MENDKPIKLYKSLFLDIFKKIESGEYSPKKKIPTEQELMSIYNVSRSTVRKALLELEKLKLIERTKKRGTFVKNYNLKKNTNAQYIIPLVLPYEENFNYPIIEEAQKHAIENNCFITFFNSNNSVMQEREILERILKMNVPGIILFPCSYFSNVDILSNLVIKGIKITFLNKRIPGIKGSLITSNNYKGAFDLTDLVCQNHKNIGYYTIYDNMSSTEIARYDGFCNALVKNNIPIDKNNIYRFQGDLRHKISSSSSNSNDIQENFAQKIVDKYIKSNNKPTAIVCVNDVAAIILIKEFQKNNIHIPDDVSIVGFDNISEAANIDIQLTTMQQQFDKFGELAAKSLFKQINYNLIDDYEINTNLVLRKSLKINDNSQNCCHK